jgi:large subunit ribosomal protein L29
VAKTKKKTEKYRGMSPDELTKEERALRDQVWKLRQQMATGQLDRPHKVAEARRDLARLLTVRRELETTAKVK